jgi:anti-sigma factor RsiW
MRNSGQNLPAACAAARDAIHARLDRDELAAGAFEELAAHLGGCSECRAFESDLEAIGAELRAIPKLELPDEVLDEVWSRTVDAPSSTASGFPRHLRPVLAAAAMLTVVVIGLWQVRGPAEPPSPTRAEVLQAAEEVRMVLALTSRQLRRAENTAVRDVLAGEISPALQQVPVRWPSTAPSPSPASEDMRSGT